MLALFFHIEGKKFLKWRMVNGEIGYSVLRSKVPNNPFESTLIAAEKIEVSIYYPRGLIIVIQLFIALCTNMIHHYKVPWLQDS